MFNKCLGAIFKSAFVKLLLLLFKINLSVFKLQVHSINAIKFLFLTALLNLFLYNVNGLVNIIILCRIIF